MKKIAITKHYLEHRLFGCVKTETLAKFSLILSWLDIREDDCFLDIGSGFNVFPLEAARRGGKVTGIDLSAEKIRFLKQASDSMGLGSINYLICDASHLPFQDGLFDKVLCSEVLEHIYDDKTVISEMARVTKVGGVCIITVPLLKFPSTEQETINGDAHAREGYTTGGLCELMQISGFSVQDIAYYNGIVANVLWKIEGIVIRGLKISNRKTNRDADRRDPSVQIVQSIPRWCIPALIAKSLLLPWLLSVDNRIRQGCKGLAIKAKRVI